MSDNDDLVTDGVESETEMADRLSLMGPAESSVKRWVLLQGDRTHLSLLLVVSVFLSLLAASVLWPFEMADLLTETETLQTLLNSLLRGTIILVSVVVSINSIVLSQDLTSLDIQQDRIESTMQFRQRVEEVAQIDVCPTEPVKLLQILLKTVLICVDEFHELTQERSAADVREEVDDYHYLVQGYTRLALDQISGDDPNYVDVLQAGIMYDYADAIHVTRQISSAHRDDLTDEQQEALDSIVESLTLFSIGHEYFKSIFYMREFGRLSKALLYVSLPIIVFISYVMLAISAGQYPGSQIPVPYVPVSFVTVFSMAAYTIALTPYVVLTAFILRSATVATRSLAAGPIVLDR